MAVSGTGDWPLRSPRANLPPWHRKQLTFGLESIRSALIVDLFFGTAAGGGTTGTVASTLAGVTSAAAGSPVVTGAVTSTLAGVTSAASGTSTVTGTASSTLAGVTSAAAGAPTITGLACATRAGVTTAGDIVVARSVAISDLTATRDHRKSEGQSKKRSRRARDRAHAPPCHTRRAMSNGV